MTVPRNAPATFASRLAPIPFGLLIHRTLSFVLKHHHHEPCIHIYFALACVTYSPLLFIRL